MKTTKRILIACILLVSIQQVAFSQERVIEPKKSPKHGIGFGAGMSTGSGLSYRFFPNKLGMQINLGGYKEYEEIDFSAGLTFLYSLRKNKYFNFYLYESNSYEYSSELIDNYSTPLTSGIVPEGSHLMEKASINNGIGFGFEAAIAQKVGINTMIGYASFDSFARVNVTAEAAIYYKF